MSHYKHNNRCVASRVHCRYGEILLGSRGSTLYFSDDHGGSWLPLLKLPVSAMTRLQAMTHISRRFFRQDVYHLIPFDQNILIAFAFRAVYVCDFHSGAILSEPAPIRGSRPAAVCLAPDGVLYYGEYRDNPGRTPVHIFGSVDQGRSWNTVYCIENVRHVHGVYYDSYEDVFWVTTGDTNAESAIWVSDDRFRSLRKVLFGSQQTRAIRLVFTPEHIYFGSDAPDARNFLYRLHRSSYHLEQLVEVGGSVFHGCKTASGIFFSTACEPSSVNDERQTVVWYSADGESWRPIRSFKKDLLPMKLFQYGQVFFTEGMEHAPGVWLTPYSTSGSLRSIYLDESDLMTRGFLHE